MKHRIAVLLLVTSLTAAAEIPPFILQGSDRVTWTALGYSAAMQDGSTVAWRRSGDGWTDGSRHFTPTPTGWRLRGSGEVYTRTASGDWSQRGAGRLYVTPTGLREGEAVHRYTATGARKD